MKIRRIRYVEPFKVEDNNPYRDKSKPPRKFWHDWIEVDVFEKAEVMQLDANHRSPGLRFMLRVPMIDPETGDVTDADGDTALLRIAMIGGTMDFIGGRPTFSGFVSEQELAHEAAYRQGDLDACLASYDKASDYKYVREEWQVS